MVKTIVVGDLHCGSKFGISSEPKNNIQKVLKSEWDNITGKYDVGILLGDACEGRDRHGSGEYNTTNNITEQIADAATLLNQLKVKKWYAVQGSPYHTDQNVSSDRLVADKIGANFGEELVVNVDGTRIHCSHAVGVSMSATAYRPTPIAREMMLNAINVAEYGKFDIILRGHAHYFCMVRFGGSAGVICPCWKGRDAFAARRTLAMLPHCGHIEILVDKDHFDIIPHVFSLKGDDIIKEYKA